MSILDYLRRKKSIKKKRKIMLANGSSFEEFIGNGYKTLDTCPEVVTACFRIAQLIASMTIYLMANTEKGDVRVINELSRKIDIEPNSTMTRSTWMTAIVMNLLLYGEGNSVVYPHTKNGLIADLEPIEANRVEFVDIVGKNDYKIKIDNVTYSHRDVMHFVFNPDKDHLWHGHSFEITLSDVTSNIDQARQTEKAFMRSKWKPSLIVKVDAMTDEFSSKEGRMKLLESYVDSGKAGEPWLIPAEEFAVEQIRPLTLADLAINENVIIDKKAVASILGVPAFLLGVGEYNAEEWDSFVNNTVRPIAMNIEQEMTRKLIISTKMHIQFNVSKLYSYDLKKLSGVYSNLYDKGIVTGNEVRDKLGMQPIDGLDNLIVLENYIPITEIGNQKKLGGTKND